MIKRMGTTAMLALVGAAWSVSAAALAPSEVQGEITDVQPDQDRFSLRVTDAGEDAPARQGVVETYQVDDTTEIRIEEAGESLFSPRYVTLDDLSPGNQVLLDFEEIEGERVARNVAISDQGQQAGSVAGTDGGAGTDGSDDTTNRERLTGDADAGADAEQETEMAAAETQRDRLPGTASPAPLLAMLGGIFAVAALVLRRARR